MKTADRENCENTRGEIIINIRTLVSFYKDAFNSLDQINLIFQIIMFS